MTAEPHSQGWIHRYPVTVQFDEVDQYGIVHHPRYLVYCERARVNLMGELGLRPGDPEAEATGIVVVGLSMSFKASARFLDQLTIEQGCPKIGAARLALAYRVLRGDELLCTADLSLAFVDRSGRPCRGPAAVRTALQSMGVPG
jgi:acyl-CoA thioester hydrolase